MFMPLPIKAFRVIDDKPKIGRQIGHSHEKAGIAPKQAQFDGG
jgi:hypothetical protein